MRRKLAAFPSGALQHLSLLIAFVLLIAAKGFAADHPPLAAGLVFIFSLPYLVAAVVTRRAHFLYATMLLGAVSYFLTCYALGAPATCFPVLAIPLVVALWFVGQHLQKRLPEELAAFPRTVYRAMNITVAAFTAWAVFQAPGLLSQSGWPRYVATVAFVGYAALYLAHCTHGAHPLYAYVFSMFAVLAAAFFGWAAWSLDYCWLPAMAAAALVLSTGTRHHGARGYGWSRHFYLCGLVVLGLSLALSAVWWAFLLFNLLLASLVLWLAYGWLAEAVGEVRGARMAERALAKGLFLGCLALNIPIALAAFIAPANIHVAVPALGAGLLFAWVALRRSREMLWGMNAYVVPAMLLGSAGLFGIGRALPGAGAAVWSVIAAFGGMLGLGWLHQRLGDAGEDAAQRAVVEGAVFPALFAWYVPLISGSPGVALLAAHAAMVVPLGLARRRGEKRFLHAFGPGLAGVLVSAAVLLGGQSPAAWVVCVAAAVVAGVLFVFADLAKRLALRVAADLGWAILSVAAVIIASLIGGASSAMCALTGVAPVALLLAGWRRRQADRDAFDNAIAAVAFLATAGAIVLGPLSGWTASAAGASLLVLAAASAAAWALCWRLRYARAAAGLFALGMMLVIFGTVGGVEARLAIGAAIVAALFVAARGVRDRLPAVSRSWAVVGHLAGIGLMIAALIQARSMAATSLALAAVPLVLLYAVVPGLRRATGFRLGVLGWATFIALFGLSSAVGVPFPEQVRVIAILAPIWLALGYGLRGTKAGGWTAPLYLCGALLAAFCAIVSLLMPAGAGTWQVFLVNGIVFATLFLILRQDVFAYLLTLSLSLLAYDWVKASTSTFTQDVLFYLVIGTAVLGVFFLLPLLKRLVDRIGTIPMISIFTLKGAAFTSVPVMCGAMLVLSAYSVKITAHPKFCTSCHNMGQYYASWQHSSHKDVACVECHYEPGVGNEIQGKMAGMIQLVKYVSHAYDSKPHAEISNASCMRSGCHADMDHNKQAVLFHGKVKFNHERHLSGHPRGKELNCVSCHGQVVEGEHITVAETACITCHFYGRGTHPVAAGECLTCHTVPQQKVVFMEQPFSHKDFLKGKTDARCEHCHSQVTQGDGHVSATRCQSCHLKRMPDIEDQEKFHLQHVSVGHFDCLQCHDEIRHGKGLRPHEKMASGNCSTCHGTKRHTIQERMYAGTAVDDVDPEPDVMFKAGVACDGCHLEEKAVKVGVATYTSRIAGSKPCADCHGDKDYAEMLTDWQTETRSRLGDLLPKLTALEQACQSAKVPKDKAAAAMKILAAARNRVDCVVQDGSYGAHNSAYVGSLLDEAEGEIEKGAALLNGHTQPQESGE